MEQKGTRVDASVKIAYKPGFAVYQASVESLYHNHEAESNQSYCFTPALLDIQLL